MDLLVVLVSAVAAMVTGAIYYSPPIFGNYWMKLTGLKMSEVNKDTVWVMYLMSFAAAIVLSFVLNFMIGYVQADSVLEALKMGFWLWLGLVATTSLTNAIYSRKPVKLLFLENGHHLLVILVISLIIGLWH